MAVERDKVLQAAQKFIERKRYDKAIVELQRLVAEDPKDVRTLLKIGDLYLKLEQYAESIDTYERVGQFYSLQGYGVKAIAVYKQIREIIHKHAPHLADRYGHVVPRLAEVYIQLGLTSDALAAYDEVATRLQRAGRDRDAIDIFKKIVDLDPSNPLPYLRLAEAFVRVKDLDAAILRFGAAGEILVKLGRRDDALKVFERLLQHRPDAKFARMASEVYLERGNPNDGMAALTKLQISFKENPKDLVTLALLARIFDKLGQPAKAVEVQKEAARIAKEAGRLETFDELVTMLLARAPNDEGVAALAAQRQRAQSSIPVISDALISEIPPASAMAESRMSVDIEVDDDDVVEMEEEVASAQPFVLRPSNHPGPLLPPLVAAQPGARDVKAALARAESYRRARDYDQAVAVLEEAQRGAPGSREIHEKLCDMFIEAGNQEAAVYQMLSFAHHLGANDDADGAARILDEVLLLEPGQRDAVNMLAALGYAVPEPASVAESHVVPYDDAPLPSYDLEEIGSADALGRSALSTSLAAGARRSSKPDHPFAADGPLPSFPIEEEATQFMDPPRFTAAPPPEAPAAPQLDEGALDEVEFFVAQDMFDEARAVIHEQLSRLPNHPLLLERLAEVEAQAAAATEHASGTREALRVPSANDLDLDRSFDIAASLEALDALDTTAAVDPADDPRQVSVESVFEQFKAGVAAQISESDAQTHYDLGYAYKEMGLIADAISEFELAARDPARECLCKSMIGMMHLQAGDSAKAIDAFILGLHASERTTDQELALTYEIGNAYETRNNAEQALYYFQLVARIDPGYRDPRGAIEDRMRRLQPAPRPDAARAAVGADHVSDEFDAAFDDLLGDDLLGGKLP